MLSKTLRSLGVAFVLLSFPSIGLGQESPSYIEELKALADLRDQGIITDEEFEQRKSEILSSAEEQPQGVDPTASDSRYVVDEPNILGVDGVVVSGKNPGDLRGRWLAVTDEKALRSYRGVYFGRLESDIEWKKERNVSEMDEEILVDKMRELIAERLREFSVFSEVMEWDVPETEAAGYLRLDCVLGVEPGSRAARYAFGLGAGKSKSLLEITLRDHLSGERVGLYHGYGVGTGMGLKTFGGGARKMTQDDIQENSKMFAKLLNDFRGR